MAAALWTLPDWQTLFDDILFRVFTCLPARSLLDAGQTCKHWYRVANDEFIWKELFYRAWQIDLSIPRAPGKTSWQAEYKRLFYHTPAMESEVIKQHNDQVLHVSFAHNGSMFATSSKDGYVKVWNTSFPVSLRYKEDMKTLTWKYTQFSQFNETDTLLLVSGVHFGSLSTSGEIAVFSLKDSFQLQCRVINKPYDVFGTWYNENYLLSGNLSWLGHLISCSALWLNKAFQALDSEHESVVMRLFRFHNVNASSIRTIMIANCYERDVNVDDSVISADPAMKKIGGHDDSHKCRDHHHGADGLQGCPGLQRMQNMRSGLQRMQNMRSFENGTYTSTFVEMDMREAADKLNGTIEYDDEYRQAEHAAQDDRTSACRPRLTKVDAALGASVSASGNCANAGDKPDFRSLCVSQNSKGEQYISISPHQRMAEKSFFRGGNDEAKTGSFDNHEAATSHFLNNSSSGGETSSSNDMFHSPSSARAAPSVLAPDCNSRQKCHAPSCSRRYCDKYLIFTTGSLTYTPHQIGIKRIKSLEALRGSEVQQSKEGVRLLPDVDENINGLEGEVEYNEVDKLINLHGHIIGMSLSPDHRYLYVNSRSWPKGYHIDNPLYPPPIAQEIDIHVIDLVKMREVGTMHRAHKAYTPNDECFFIFLDVCDEYVASGAEDKHGYVWDRHYGLCLNRFPHSDVVNAVAFNPQDPEMLVTVSDDSTIKIWRSRNREKEMKFRPAIAMDLEEP